ncbi:hypothetical protein GALMADRAFT_218252 [Galerina marginata CBS 339.88]|uniref:Uncharacterized protein n=1 Tax=Galerina marginata (strain CBS 339.88) TaxID=685588 RepID=A0A067TPR1_GALM3|nr:hypothetical protein GALMADRAFT_218252 [Galerina marginata CBS 339.88]
MADKVKPPFYVLLAHSSLSNLPSGALSNTLGHPVIQYHYADDSPLSLLPAHLDEHVLVLHYDTNSPKPTVQSISEGLSVTGLKLEDAPGAAVEDETGTRNDTVFIIETTGNDQYALSTVSIYNSPHFPFSSMTASHGDRKSAAAILAQYKHR